MPFCTTNRKSRLNAALYVTMRAIRTLILSKMAMV
jgi:hypothetical protein